MKKKYFLFLLFFFLFSFNLFSYQVLISENFDGSEFPPAGWIIGPGTDTYTTNHSSPYSVRFNANGDSLITPLLNNPDTISFYIYSAAGTPVSFLIEKSDTITTGWTTLLEITDDLKSKFNYYSIDLSSFSNIYIKFRRNTTTSKYYYIDDVVITARETQAPTSELEKPVILSPTTSLNYNTGGFTISQITLSGTAAIGCTVSLFLNNLFLFDSPNLQSINWSFLISINSGLKINDTNIIAVRADSASIYSDTAYLNLIIDTLPPIQKTQLNIPNSTNAIVNFNVDIFADSSLISTYIVELSKTSSFTTIIDSYQSSTPQITSNPLSEDTYYIRVKAIDIFGQASEYSNVDEFQIQKIKVVINEINSDNTQSGGAEDANGDGVWDDKDDFIEIYNYGDVAVDISNWKLSDNDTNSYEFTFPAGTIIEPKEFITVFGGTDTSIIKNISGKYFGCNGLSINATSADTVYLFDNNNNVIDSYAYTTSGNAEIDADQSITRYPDGTGSFIKSSLVHPAKKRVTPNRPYNDMDGFLNASITPSSMTSGIFFEIKIDLIAETNTGGGTIAIILPSYFPAFSLNSDDSGYFTFSGSKAIQTSNFQLQSNILFITLPDSYSYQDTLSIIYGAGNKAIVSLSNFTIDSISVFFSDSNVYGGLLKAATYNIAIYLQDLTPPASITDLQVVSVSSTSVTLQWTASGDNGTDGTAASYDIRYSLTPINDTTAFLSAQQAAGISAKTPAPGGSIESFTVTGLIPDETYYFVIAVFDANGNTSPITFSNVSAKTSIEFTDHIVISEVKYEGVGSANDEFIELYNPAPYDINISGWVIKKKSGTGTTETTIKTISSNKIIKSFGYFLIANTGFAQINTIIPDDTTTQIIAANNVILLYDTSNTLIDKVGYGVVGDSEMQSCTDPGSGKSIERKAQKNSTPLSMTTGADSLAGNSFDMNNNYFDFIVRESPDPQNSVSNKEIPPYFTLPSPPTLIYPETDVITKDTIAHFVGLCSNDLIGYKVYLVRNSEKIDSQIIEQESFIFNNIPLIQNSNNIFYFVIEDSGIANLFSNPSNAINILCDVSGPQPSSFSFEDTYSIKPTLTFPVFSDSINISNYIVYIDDNLQFSSPDIYSVSTNKIIIDTPLVEFTTYYVKIKGIDALDNIGQFSEIAQFTILAYIPAPLITAPVSGFNTKAETIIISGTYPSISNVDSVVLFLDNIAYDTVNLINNQFSFILSNISNGNHSCYVKAYQSQNKYYSAKSNEINFLFDNEGPVPITLSFDKFYSTNIIISFSDFSDLVGVDTYFIFVSLNQDLSDSTTYITKYPYLSINLTYDTFYIGVYAIDKLGNIGQMSNIAQLIITNQTEKNYLLISEIYAKNGSEFVEIYNPSANEISVKGYYLAYFTKDRNWNQPYRNYAFPNTTIKPFSYFLIAFSYTGSADWQPTTSDVLNGAEGSIGIFDTDVSKLTVEQAQTRKIDVVGWGGAQFVFEGTKLSAINDSPVERKANQNSTSASMTSGADLLAGNSYDSDNNSNDFVFNSSPNPQNSNFTEPDFISPNDVIIDTIVPSSNAVVIYWQISTASDFAKYEIYFSTEEISYINDAVLIKTIEDKNITQAKITDLQNNVKYYFAVVAVDFANNKDLFPSSVISAIPLTSLADNTPPLQINDLRVSDSTATSIKLIWTTPVDEEQGKPEQYILKYSTTPIQTINDFYNATLDTAILSKKPLNAGEIDSYTVLNLLPATLYYFALVSVDLHNNTSNISIVSSYTKSGISETIVISELGKKYNNISNNHYVELYNPTNEVVSLNGYALQRGTGKPGTVSKITFSANDKILPYSYFLVANDAASETMLALADKTFEDLTFGTDGFIALTPFSENISENNYHLAVDLVGWSKDAFSEGSPFSSAPADNKSLERKAKITSTKESLSTDADSQSANAFDSNDNLLDFVVQDKPVPQSSKSLVEIPAGISSPDTVPPQKLTTLTAFDYFENGAIKLQWQPVIDYDNYGRKSTILKYIIKYSQSPIQNETDFNNATTIFSDIMNISPDSNYVNYIIKNLNPGLTYYFAIKTEDRFQNVSEISNSISHTAFIMPVLITSNIQNNQNNVFTNTKIILSFSQAMDTNSVIQNLSITPTQNYNYNWLDEQTLEIIINLTTNQKYQIKIRADNTYDKQHITSIDGNNNGFAEGSPYDNFLMEFTTIKNLIVIPDEINTNYEITINDLLLSDSITTIYLNNCPELKINITGLNNFDKWCINYIPDDTGNYLTISTDFNKIVDSQNNFYIANDTNLNRTIQLYAVDKEGNEISSPDFELKFYYNYLSYQSENYLGIFKDISSNENILYFAEIINKDYFDNSICSDTDYELNTTNKYISIKVKKNGKYGIGERSLNIYSLDKQNISISLQNNLDSIVIAAFNITGKYSDDIIKSIKFTNLYNLTNNSVTVYLYKSNDNNYDATDIFICKLQKSDTYSFKNPVDIPISENYKFLLIGDFKNINTGDAISLFISKEDLILENSDTTNLISDIYSEKIVSFYDVASADEQVKVLINELCITPKQDWSSVNYQYTLNSSFSSTKVGDDDEFIELLNNTNKAIDISSWNLIVKDNENERCNVTFTELANDTTVVLNFSKGGNITNFLPDEYLVIGNPPSSLISDIQVLLYNNLNQLIDSVTTGSLNDGNTQDNAPSGTATSSIDEAIARFPDATNTGNNKTDFRKMTATPGYRNLIVPVAPTIIFPFNSANVDTYYCMNSSILLQGLANYGTMIVIELNDVNIIETKANIFDKFSVTLNPENGININNSNIIKCFSYTYDNDNIIKSDDITKYIVIDTLLPQVSLIKPIEHFYSSDYSQKINLIGKVTSVIPIKEVKIKRNGFDTETIYLDENNYFYYSFELDTDYQTTLSIMPINLLGYYKENIFNFYRINKIAEIVLDTDIIVDTNNLFSNKSVSYLINNYNEPSIELNIPNKLKNNYDNNWNLRIKLKEDNKYYFTIIKADTVEYEYGTEEMLDYKENSFTLVKFQLTDIKGNYVG
ncbi:MAG TPA: lamin tail domain-containing protein, partial [bacterium]|nr:lamin tail domain-containing protein [bacterium]